MLQLVPQPLRAPVSDRPRVSRVRMRVWTLACETVLPAYDASVGRLHAVYSIGCWCARDRQDGAPPHRDG